MKTQYFYFLGVVGVVLLIMIYVFGGTQANENYLKKVSEFRATKDRHFKESENSPLDKKERKTFQGLKYYEINPAYKLEADFIPFDIKQTIEISTSTGTSKRYQKFGYVRFTFMNIQHQLLLLKPLERGASSIFFLAFTDETSGKETYGGGRYLDVEIKKGKAILDFNFAYNPYCAYNSAYECPIPPKENHLPIPILAGEKNYK
ncbi:MAG: DUF1684 domain-containing protein [Cytophagales bacterium]|nr:DUF1684 domain-containing protein [Cytophagales bacterium]MDW8384316.1 DUF1684 domain-containing protein [Flammeovirgaceae bacterium]